MKTRAAFYRTRAVLAVGMLLTAAFVGGCITQKPGAQDQDANNSKPARTPPRKNITHPGGRSDNSKDAPTTGTSSAHITHPAG